MKQLILQHNLNIGYSAWRYSLALVLPILYFISFYAPATIFAWLPLLFAFGIIPALEMLVPPNNENYLEELEQDLLKSPVYDFLLLLSLPIVYVSLYYMFASIDGMIDQPFRLLGSTIGLGLILGILGINVAHELGHRDSSWAKWTAQALLLPNLYMHFTLEHNFGHHRWVATPNDPATARLNEWIYAFYFRSIINSYKSAIGLEKNRLQKINKPFVSFKNILIQQAFLQLLYLVIVYLFGGITALMVALSAAFTGILLLETVNYIEHYGLQRKQLKPKVYEAVSPKHSWNSNHIFGRLMLFELSRHSDHHYRSSRKYQVLRSLEHSPQMPAGYPAMMLLALVPPLWFRVMNKQLEKEY